MEVLGETDLAASRTKTFEKAPLGEHYYLEDSSRKFKLILVVN